MVQYNGFVKSQDNKSGFFLKEGKPILSDKIYVVNPTYVHSRSPQFSIVARGKHISGLFCVSQSVYLGDYEKKSLVVFINNEGLDLFIIDQNPIQTKHALLTGALGDLLAKARREAGANG